MRKISRISVNNFCVFDLFHRLCKSFCAIRDNVAVVWFASFSGTVLLLLHGFLMRDMLGQKEAIAFALVIVVSFFVGLLLISEYYAIRNKTDQLVNEKEKFRSLLDDLKFGVYRRSVENGGKFIELNTGLVELLDASSKEELMMHNVTDFYQDKKEMSQFAEKIKKDGCVIGQELHIVSLKGRKFIASVTAVLKKDASDKFFIDGVFEDISEWKKIEEQLTAEKVRVEAILSSIGEATIVQDTHGKILFVNGKAEQLFGIPRVSMIGRSSFDVIHFVDAERRELRDEIRLMQMAVETGKVVKNDKIFFVQKDKSLLPLAVTASPVLVDQKNIGLVSIYRDITQEKEIEYAKTHFVSLAAHQLRTPLSGTKWIIDLLRQNNSLQPSEKKRLDQLYGLNERLIFLVNDLLNVSHVETGSLTVEKKKIDVVHSIEEVVGLLKSDAIAKKQKIVVRTAVKKVALVSDPVLLEEVLKNLLSNAIQYGKVDSKITISIESKSSFVFISVHNVGSFIEPSEFDKIFTKFYRSAAAQKLRPNGTGLGLFFAKSVVDALHGQIGFSSSLKEGTTFYFTLFKKNA